MEALSSDGTLGGVDLRTRTSLFCAVLALAIAVSHAFLLHGRQRRAQLLFAAFAADVGLWYLAQWLYHVRGVDVWARFTALLAVFLPQFAVHLFEAILPDRGRRSLLLRVAGFLLIPMAALVLLPHAHRWVRDVVFFYVFGLIAAGLWSLARRGERSGSRATQRRVRFLVLIGTLAAAFTLADFLWFIGAPLPPVGAVLSIVFLFVLAESMRRQRLVDLYDILGQLLVSTALAFALAGIFYVFVDLLGGFNTMYLGAILAAIVILVLFQPLREKVEAYIHKAFFRERVDLERAVTHARGALTHVLEVEEMVQVVVRSIEASRRATGAALYLREPLGPDFVLGQAFGPAAPGRIDGAIARPLIEKLTESASVVLEQVAYEVAERRRAGWTPEAEADERILSAAKVLGPFAEAVCLSVHGEGRQLVAVVCVVDDRVRDAFSSDEVALLESLALQMGVVIDNSRQYRRMQERDRLAALGQMAAGLAHEVKNPLGAIKGAAQLLSEPADGGKLGASEREFLEIIIEEVDRLDRVVGSVLNYARPSKGNPGAVDVNDVVKGTLRLVASDPNQRCTVSADLGDDLPLVRADAEQLRQVLLNLVKNGVQATTGEGRVSLSTRLRQRELSSPNPHAATTDAWVEISVRDDGTGIGPQVLKNLFVPFFSTKHKGTGLGLAISQRIVEEMGGHIEVVSQPGAGSTFTVVLPTAGDPVATPPLASTGAVAKSPAPAPTSADSKSSAPGPTSMASAEGRRPAAGSRA